MDFNIDSDMVVCLSGILRIKYQTSLKFGNLLKIPQRRLWFKITLHVYSHNPVITHDANLYRRKYVSEKLLNAKRAFFPFGETWGPFPKEIFIAAFCHGPGDISWWLVKMQTSPLLHVFIPSVKC